MFDGLIWANDLRGPFQLWLQLPSACALLVGVWAAGEGRGSREKGRWAWLS